MLKHTDRNSDAKRILRILHPILWDDPQVPRADQRRHRDLENGHAGVSCQSYWPVILGHIDPFRDLNSVRVVFAGMNVEFGGRGSYWQGWFRTSSFHFDVQIPKRMT